MEVLTVAQMRQAEKRAEAEAGMPTLIMMENAGRAIFAAIAAVASPAGKRIAVICGGGNNGGDGFVAARHLAAAGAAVTAWVAVPREKLHGDAAVNYRILEHSPVPLQHILVEADLDKLDQSLQSADFAVDCLLGTGITRKVEGIYKGIIDVLNGFEGRVIAADIPSGIDADSGEVLGAAVKAWLTVTFAFPKRGQLFFPGREYCGRLQVADIFIPTRYAVDATGVSLLTPDIVCGLLPPRREDSHKGDYGRVFVLAGASGFTGAAYFTSMAAQRSGAGLVTLGIPAGLHSITAGLMPEVMHIPLEETGEGSLSPEICAGLLKLAAKSSVLAAGPGLTAGENIRTIIGSLLENYPGPLVLDADALNAIAPDSGMLAGAAVPPVITPHPGEMARLAGLSKKDVVRNSLELAREKASQWQAIIVLKGAPTVVALPGGKAYINATGNDGMATGGAGDVLTGLVAGFIAQGAAPAAAAPAAVYIHGLAGDLAAQEQGKRGMIASDILHHIPRAMEVIIKGDKRK